VHGRLMRDLRTARASPHPHPHPTTNRTGVVRMHSPIRCVSVTMRRWTARFPRGSVPHAS
jgi:hypothetical protein